MSHADPSLSPLMALLGQAERERDDAVAQARRAEAQLATAQGQGEQLLSYRQDYEARFRERFSRQGAIDTFQTYQGFMGRLSLAVDQQQGVVTLAARRVDAARQVVREHELRVASVRKLIERRLAELRIAADRRDQKQTDEFASRAAWNRLAAQQAAPSA
jgi:flagellar FliJ protein